MNILKKSLQIEWPTLGLLLLCAVSVPLLTALGATIPLWINVPALAVILALHSSLQHEVLHGHPTKNPVLNEALVFIPAALFLPYRRFRDTHIQHHNDSRLTDPYDDPETNFQDPVAWAKTGQLKRVVLIFNNTLFGRMLIGPLIGFQAFYRGDIKLILAGNRAVINAYALHLVGLVPVVLWLTLFSTMPFWAYLLAAYASVSLLKIRTFLEHRAHLDCAARTVIIEDRGFLAFLFLNNNFHAVHHSNPKLAWYKIPGAYAQDRLAYLEKNGGYAYPNYRDIFRRYFFKGKDQVAHPLWRPNEQK